VAADVAIGLTYEDPDHRRAFLRACDLFERWLFRRRGGDARVPHAGGAPAETATAGHRAHGEGTRRRYPAGRAWRRGDRGGAPRAARARRQPRPGVSRGGGSLASLRGLSLSPLPQLLRVR